jgi:hypothetical protein
MRTGWVPVVVMTVAVLALASPAAAAQYRFVATNGSSCTVTTTHGTAPEAGGTYTASWQSSIRCDARMAQMFLSPFLTVPPGTQYNSSPSYYISCSDAHVPCDTATHSIGGSASGLVADTYTHTTGVSIVLPASTPPAVWATVPAARADRSSPLDCLPGQQSVTCSFNEKFSP